MKKAEILYYVNKRKEGWEISQIRKEIESQGYEKDDVFYYLNEIDDEFVKTINEKSDFTVSNVSLRIIELILGLGILIVGLFFLSICILVGPGILSILIGFGATSSGYYLSKRGWQGIKAIKNASQEKIRAKNEWNNDVLD